MSQEKVERRRDDSLWKELLTRFFIPMLNSVLPDLAKDIDPCRPVFFLDKELRRLARFTRSSGGASPTGTVLWIFWRTSRC